MSFIYKILKQPLKKAKKKKQKTKQYINLKQDYLTYLTDVLKVQILCFLFQQLTENKKKTLFQYLEVAQTIFHILFTRCYLFNTV